MKHVKSAIALVAMMWVAGAAQAQLTTSNNFTVQVSLASRCEATNSGTRTVNFGTYEAFQQTTQNSNSQTLFFRCTRTFPIVGVAFDTVEGTAVGEGVLAGLRYVLTATAQTVQNGSPATTGNIGSPDLRNYVVSGTMEPDQAGTCTTATCTLSHSRTLIMTF